MAALLQFLTNVFVIARMDVRTWLRQPANIAATIVPPLAFLLVQARRPRSLNARADQADKN